MTVHDAAATGDRVATLEELRDTLARAIDGCESGRDLAALSNAMTRAMDQLAELVPSEEVDAVDEIAARRNARRASATSSSSRTKRSS